MFLIVLAELNNRTIQVSHLPCRTKLKELIKYFKTAVNARLPAKEIIGNRRWIYAHFLLIYCSPVPVL